MKKIVTQPDNPDKSDKRANPKVTRGIPLGYVVLAAQENFNGEVFWFNTEEFSVEPGMPPVRGYVKCARCIE